MKSDPTRKIDIVVVQAFPANETLSSGIIKYLGNFFTVHFVNLPGFHPTVSAVEDVSISKLVRYVENEIDKLQLDHYVLAGISFGFALANKVRLSKVKGKCIAILGSGPYLGRNYLNFSFYKRMLFTGLVSFIDLTNLGPWLWRRRWIKPLMVHFMGKKSRKIIESINAEVDPRTFFRTALLILKYDEKPQFKDIPYILLMNPNDGAVKFIPTFYEFFNKLDIRKFRFIATDVEHYPKNPSYKYFKRAFTNNEITSLFNFFEYSDNV